MVLYFRLIFYVHHQLIVGNVCDGLNTLLPHSCIGYGCGMAALLIAKVTAYASYLACEGCKATTLSDGTMEV